MKPVTALVIDGPDRGKVVTSRNETLIYDTMPTTPFDVGLSEVPYERHLLLAQRVRVGERLFGVWVPGSWGRTSDDVESAILALIDAEPADVRRVEVAP